MAFRLVIFDFDGTLADSLGWLREALQELAAERGYRRAGALELESLRALGPREALRQLGFPTWRIPRLAASMKDAMRRDVDRIPLFDGVDRLLRGLSGAGVTIAIVSSNARGNVVRVLGPENAARIAQLECDVPLLGKRSRFRRLVQRCQVGRHEVLCVGDEIRDLDAAREEGLAFGAVSWGYATREALAARAPTVLFDRIDEILEFVTR